MTNPVIDSNVPLPRRRNDYAVLDALEVGQSVLGILGQGDRDSEVIPIRIPKLI